MRKSLTKLFSGLSRTRDAIVDGIQRALKGGRPLDEEALAVIEETLIAADVGVETSLFLVERLRAASSDMDDTSMEAVGRFLAEEIGFLFEERQKSPPTECGSSRSGPHVTMVVGVNGTGKTTTIGKLAGLYARRGDTVLLAAADTFRAAAGEQLEIWAKRTGAEFVFGEQGGDPASVAYDALEAAMSRGVDRLIVDTAGRLHTQRNLISELAKIRRVLAKRLPGAPDDVLLVIDANTGQNAVTQARLFDEAVGVTGIVLTKLDGTARGGIVIAIARELAIPVRFVGTGESVEDLTEFDAREFARGLMPVQDAQ
ncbi:signal recognition particle-docking protein FtsY [bacterium]|nr:signal recognition particle-docking protein FtsY [bacterium]